jgi:DNA-binding NarL/FixJ family response regulator
MLCQVPDIEIVMQSDNAGDAPALCSAYTPDLLVMDILSKDWGLLEYIPHIKQGFPAIKVFVMIGVKDNRLALKAKEAGADIVARKNISLDDFKQLIRLSQKHYRVFPHTLPDSKEPP